MTKINTKQVAARTTAKLGCQRERKSERILLGKKDAVVLRRYSNLRSVNLSLLMMTTSEPKLTCTLIRASPDQPVVTSLSLEGLALTTRPLA